MTFEIQTHTLIVKPKDEPISSGRATIIRIDDEADGPFVVVAQHSREIAIEWEEWPHIREAIERMMLLCQPAKPTAVYMHPGYSERQWDGKGDKPEWMQEWIKAGNDPMECLVS